MVWDTDQNGSNLVSKDEAKRQIVQMAKDEDIKGAFKVFYDGSLVANPDDLPDQVDMDKVSVSAVLDQA